MTRTSRLTVAAMVLACAGLGWAQPEMMDGPPMRPPAFVRELFPPSLIMRHQSDIALSAAQREAITREIGEVQPRLLALRWELEEKTAALGKLLAAERVDETAALERVDRVMQLEEQMKRIHLGMLIRLKNQLSAEQQATLRTLRLRRLRERADAWRGGRSRPEAPEDEPEAPGGPEPPEP